ncbi:MAG: hypothetical protein ACI4RD_06720 [Kiritimatiellia bacterium]
MIVRQSVRTALATAVAGAVVCLSGCDRRPADEPAAGLRAAEASVSAPTGQVTVERRRVGQRTAAAVPTGDRKQKLPDALMRRLVNQAVDENDYAKLAKLSGKLDQIGDPQIRLRLLEGLNWFDATAVADAIPFLLDEDSRVASLAGEIVSSRIASVALPAQREQLFVAALKLMPDSPDRDLLIAALESERKSLCLHVLRDLEPMRTAQPELWRKLTAVYEAQFDRPYVSHIDALQHYNPREN